MVYSSSLYFETRINSMKAFLISAVFSVSLASASSAATIASTFDSDAEGWTANVPEGTLSYLGAGGNPGGHIRISDSGIGVVNGFASGALAGPAFSGDLRAYDGGTLSIDMKTFGLVRPAFASFGTVFLFAAGDADPEDQTPDAMFDFAGPAPSNAVWDTYEIPFAAATFGKSQAEWEAILADIDTFGFSTDAFDGGDTIGIDNVILSSPASVIPLPGAAILALSGMLLLVGASRRR